MAVDALALHIKGMLADGETIPPPSTLDQLANDRARRGALAVLVSAPQTERTVRVSITARESQLQLIDQLAKEAGLTWSAYIVEAATRGKPTRRGPRLL
jgi:hypothetical protein